MTWHRTEEEVEKIIRDMSNRIKGNYITQGVAFNKTCPRQMALLKKALMYSASFSGLAKEILALKFNDEPNQPAIQSRNNPVKQNFKLKDRDVGNFF